MLATLIVLFLAVMVFATHGAASCDHQMDDRSIASTTATICLAIVEVGIVLSFAGFFLLNRDLRPGPLAPTFVAFSRPPLIRGLGPPGLRAALFQVFLR